MASKNKPIIDISFAYNPLEETLEYEYKKKAVFIGIPNDFSYNENRIALTPQAVATLVQNGNKVRVEHNAGKASFYSDKDYSEAGAEIAHDKANIFQADIILKTAPIVKDEFPLLKENQIIFSTIHTPILTKEYLQNCIDKKIIAIALGSIKDDVGHFPVVRSMSQIAGINSIQIASHYLSNNQNGKGVLLGGIDGVPPANVVIIGAGMVGEYATRA
ncbi:MAG: alanine dehydrogenase, partial [Chitinophagaceae bacterium]|nr:alanine dehydrogenase [Chitinophagaceae bacterium]